MKKILAVIITILCLCGTASANNWWIADNEGILSLEDGTNGLVMSIDTKSGNVKAMFTYGGKVVPVMGYYFFRGQITSSGMDIWATEGGSNPWDYLGRY